MTKQDSRQIGRILLEMGVLRQSQLQAALAEQRRNGGRLGEILTERGVVTSEDLSRGVALQKGLEWVSAESLQPEAEAVALLDAATARAFGVLPIGVEKGKLRLAVADADSLPLLGDLEGMTGHPVEPLLADP
ncbi:MAG: hypothetical protein QGH77_01290, partial [Planctomycetota bacterium]|nr:hypothetical protein [Planctomycetota bacterium]